MKEPSSGLFGTLQEPHIRADPPHCSVQASSVPVRANEAKNEHHLLRQQFQLLQLNVDNLQH